MILQDEFTYECSGKYFFIERAPLTYAAATMSCTKSGGRLMKLDQRRKSDCVKQAVRNAGENGGDFWIGLLRLDHNVDDFIWTDGTLLGSGYSRWGR